VRIVEDFDSVVSLVLEQFAGFPASIRARKTIPDNTFWRMFKDGARRV
jgi:hypothetical protein